MSTRVNPVGVALAVLGTVATTLAIFLPLRQSTRFGGVIDNTLVQSNSDGIGWLIVGSVSVLILTYRYVRRGEAGLAVAIIGVLLVVGAAGLSLSDSLFTLYTVDPATGNPLQGGPSEQASPGIALYVAGLGGVMVAIGGWLMWRHSDEIGSAVRPVPDAPAAPMAMKRCPECAEDVRFEARVCRFCGYEFVKEPSGWT